MTDLDLAAESDDHRSAVAAPASPASPTAPQHRRRIVRLALAGGVAAGCCLAAWATLPRVLSGRTDIVGYPIYADFDVNHYLDVFYLIAIVFPLLAVVCYHLLARFGPLPRTGTRRRAIRSGTPLLLGDDVEGSRPLSALAIAGRLAVTGGVIGLEASIAAGGGITGIPTALTIGIAALGYGLVVVGLTAAARRLDLFASRDRPWSSDLAAGNLAGAVAAVLLIVLVSARTAVTVTSTGTVTAFPFFPLVVALPVVLVLGVVLWWCHARRARLVRELERGLLCYGIVPIAIFLVVGFLPGSLGPMDVFAEGEYLAGSLLVLHGAMPWRDIYLLHGLLDDAVKPMVGYLVFGTSRWGATAGITLFFFPAYFVAYYLFGAYLFRRRFALVVASVVCLTCGIFVDWDVRYLLWPLVLISFTALLVRATWARATVFALAVIGEAIVVPELTYALPALGLTLIAYELYERPPGRLRRQDFARSIPTLIVGAATTLGFGLYLALSGALSGFIGYFEDVATAHSLTGGVPLFVNYARPGTPDALGVLRFSTAEGPTISRYPIELVLPLVCILATIFLISGRVRAGKRLAVEDFVTIGAAGLVLLYYQKGISRGDNSHIGEVFAVTVPLVMLLAYRAIDGVDGLLRWARHRHLATRGPRETRPDSPPRRLLSRLPARLLRPPVAPASVVALLVLLVLAPTSPATLLNAALTHFRATAPTPQTPPAAPGDPSLGFASSDALPPHLLADLNAILTAEAGPTSAVFDLSDAPGAVEFLLDHRPGTRLYDISIAITPTAQRQVIADLRRSRPRVVLFAGVVGLSYWDFIENEVRQYLVADYILDNYRPLVAVDGELVLLADSRTAAPLPKLLGKASTSVLYFSQAVCGFGYIPNFLASPGTPAGAISVPLVPVPTNGKGRLYKLTLPANRHIVQWFALTRSGGRGPASVTLGNVIRRSGRDIPWHDITWVAATPGTTSVSVGSCLQWHGYGPTLYLRYLGPGSPVAIRLF